MNRRSTMGPPSSEPEQREYIVERVAEGTPGECVTVWSHHALAACREYAEDRGIAGPWHDYAPIPGVWCMGNATTVVRAIAASIYGAAKILGEAPLHFMRRDPPREDETAAMQLSERARLQRTLADMIRAVPDDARDSAAAGIFRGSIGGQDVAYAALAACAKYPEILDAVRQVAQVHRLQEG